MWQFLIMEAEATSSAPYLLSRLDNSKIIFNEPEFTIGRGLSNSYVLENLQISRIHCKFEEHNGVWYLTDQSSNGTLVNKRKIPAKIPLCISNGDLIRLTDNLEFVFVNMKRDSLDDLDLSAIVEAAEVKCNNPPAAEVANFNQCENLPANMRKQNEEGKRIIANSEILNVASTSSQDMIPLTNCANEVASASSASVNVQNELCQRLQPAQSTADHLEQVEDELQCIICTELFIKATTLNCSHSFCKYCLDEWRKKNRKCPICRTKITTANPTIVLDNFISKVMESAAANVKEKRAEVIKYREQQAQAAPATTSKMGRPLRARLIATPIEISSEDDEDSYDDDVVLDYEHYDEENYNGVPGAYYGGYGHCYSCGDGGHWANGCPYR